MPNDTKIPTTDKSFAVQAWEKRRAELLQLLGMRDAPDDGLKAIDAGIRTGMKQIDKEAEQNQYAFECSAEWHFARFKGTGATLVGPVYHIMFRLADKSGTFNSSGRRLAKYLGAKEDAIYGAIDLLVASGFIELLEQEIGKPTRYRPLGHADWSRKTGELYCCAKWSNPFGRDDENADLGRKLYAILGGQRIFSDMLAGWLKGVTEEELCSVAKAFMAGDKNNGGGTARRVRFSEFLKKYKGSKK